jgi:copper transport protein
VLFLLVLVGSLGVTSPAAAHLALRSTDPAHGAQLAQSPERITLTFTKAARPAPDGLRLARASGEAVATTAVARQDGVVWVVRPASPLPPGRYRLTWRVVSDDSHVRSGRVAFGIAPAVAGTPAAASTPEAAPPATGAAASAHATDGDHAGMAGMAGMDHAAEATADDGRAPWWGVLGGVGRWLSIAGVLVAVGALAVALTTLVGSAGDVGLAQRVVRTAAAAAAVGALLDGAVLLLTLGGAVPPSAAAAVLVRLAGAAALAVAVGLRARPTGGRRSRDVEALPPEPTGRGHGTTLLLAPPVRTGRVGATLTRPAPVALASTAVIASFCLDGHTASVAPRPVMIAADVVHTTGAAVWSGGVVLLATLLLVRARAGVPTGAGELAVRFSVPASAAAAAVAGAGAVLLVLILDEPAQLLTTPWGRVMAAKLVLVGVVALLGYANNRYAVPALDAWRPHTARMLRRTVAVEGAVMVAVLAVTAVLVGSGM